MKAPRKPLKTRLFGIHKKTTESYLDSLKQFQEDELAKLSEVLQQKEAAKVKLEAELRVRKAFAGEPLQGKRTDAGNIVPFVRKQDADVSDEVLDGAADVVEQVEEHAGESKVSVEPKPKIDPMPVEEHAPELVTEPEPVAEHAPELVTDLEPVEEPEPVQEPVRAETQPPDAATCKAEIPSSGFWETADYYLQAAPGWEPHYMDEAAAAATEAAAVPLSMPKAKAQKLELKKAAAPSADAQAPGPKAMPSAPSPAITDEIASIRRKYIVGKAAGEDLVDSKGSLIIAKYGLITEDVMRRADEEGKLAELIAFMVIPGMEDR